jgi:hypothetical protein
VENDSSVPVSGSLSGKNSFGKTSAAAAEYTAKSSYSSACR